jgi:hypothetical protein
MVKLTEELFPERGAQERFICQGTIPMAIWRRIMKMIKPTVTYELWRLTYWGESVGEMEITEDYSTSHVLLATFTAAKDDRKTHLLYAYGRLRWYSGSPLNPTSYYNELASQAIWEKSSS